LEVLFVVQKFFWGKNFLGNFLYLSFMKLSKILFEVESQRPPKASDVDDAIETAMETYPEEFSDDTSRSDFELNYLGMLSVDDLKQYDDIDSWMEDVEDEDELKSFRGERWKKLSDTWGNTPPPIVVVTGDNFSMVGDGRGRVTYANYKKIPLEVWELRYKAK
jgi:hypothetical protein